MDSRPPNLLLLLLLHFWQCDRGQSSYIIDQVGLVILPSNTVESGTPVILSCKVSVSHNNIPDLTHTFQLTRDGVLINSSTTTEDKIEYEINPARAADSGSYECRVTVKDKSRASFSQKLTVTGLQTPVLYLNKTTPYESEEFIATCSAPEEKGVLIFRFYQRFRSREPKTIKQQAVTGNSLEITLALREVGDSLLYCDYEISLVSRRSNSSDEIQVIVKALMISPVMNVRPSSDVFEGDTLSVVCKVVNPPMNVEVFLTKDRRILKQATTDLVYNFTAQDGDSGELACKAVWHSVQKETYHTIRVRELFSKPRLVVEPIDVFEGEHYRLTCSVEIYEKEKINNTTRYSIYKDNVKFKSAKTYDAVAGPSINGNYSCKVHAATSTHSFVKESQTVVVKTKVHVSKPVLSVVGGTLILGKPFQLLCHSNNGTLPITYTLHSPNQLPLNSVVHRPGELAIFNSSAINRKSDLNTFICHGRNSQYKTSVTETGNLLRSTNIIEPVTKPMLTMLPRMGDVSEGQDVTLVCSVQSGTRPIRFTWYHSNREGALAFQTTMELKGSYTINNIKGVHQGEYYCTSTNSANKMEKSDAVVIGVKWAGWKKGLIATFCILFILAMILFLIFKRRLLPVKKKTTGKLSVKSSGTKTERLSLTQAEVNEPANATPGMIGKSIWSEHVSGSESDDQNSVTSPQQPEPQYTEVQTRQADPNRALVKKGTDTVYSEVRNSKQGAPEQADGQGSVEYAQLNHDSDHRSDHGNHGHHSVQDVHTEEIDTAERGELKHEPAPDC